MSGDGHGAESGRVVYGFYLWDAPDLKAIRRDP